MRKYLLIIPIIFSVIGCTKKVYIPVETSTKIELRDSLIYVHDTTFVYLPAEEKQVQILEDSSHLETNYAISDAWVDEGKLNHKLENKTDTPIKVVRDTVFVVENRIEYKEVPVEVPVEVPFIPTWCWWIIVYAGVSATWTIARLLKNFM